MIGTPAPPPTGSTTVTTSEPVRATIGAAETNGSPSVIVVTQSKIALLTQAALSIIAGVFAVALSVAFVMPIFTKLQPIMTAGEFIGGIGVTANIIAGTSLATMRGNQSRATDGVRPASSPTP